MRNYILLATFLFISTNLLNGQEILEMEKSMSLGTKSAFVINHPNATTQMAEDAWEEFMSKNGKAKRNRKSKEYETNDTKINMISSSELDIFFKAEKMSDRAATFIFIDDGTKFVNGTNDPETTDKIYEFLTPYVYAVQKLVIEEDLSIEEKTLKGLSKDLTKLEDQNERYHSEIEKYKEKIRQAELNIEENLTNQETKKTEIKNQEETIVEVKKKLDTIGINQ